MEPELPPAVLAEVCQAFRLGSPSTVTYLRDGRVNANFLVPTDAGSYVVRRSRADRTPASVAFEHALMSYLSRRGFPTPPLKTIIEGTTLLALDDGIYRVTTFVPGARCRTGEDLRACAQTLALHHRLVADYGRGPRPGFVPLRDELVGGMSLLPPCEGRHLPSPIPPQIPLPDGRNTGGACAAGPVGTTHNDPPGWLETLGSSLTTTCARLAEAEPPTTIIVHASCRRQSFVLRDGRVVAMLDYDNVQVDARTLDLAIALLSFAVVRPGKTVLDLERAAAFIAAYAVVCPLTSEEMELVFCYTRAPHSQTCARSLPPLPSRPPSIARGEAASRRDASPLAP